MLAEGVEEFRTALGVGDSGAACIVVGTLNRPLLVVWSTSPKEPMPDSGGTQMLG